MMTKGKLIDAIQRLPEGFSMDDVLDEILLIQKIENGLSQSDNDNIISDSELDKHLPEWLN